MTQWTKLEDETLDSVSGGLNIRTLGLHSAVDASHPVAFGPNAPIGGLVPAGTAPFGLDPYAQPGAPALFPQQPIYQAYPAGPVYQPLPALTVVPQPQANPLGAISALPGIFNALQGGNPLAAIGPIGNLIGQATGNPQIGQIASLAGPLVSSFLGGGGSNPLGSLLGGGGANPLGSLLGGGLGNLFGPGGGGSPGGDGFGFF